MSNEYKPYVVVTLNRSSSNSPTYHDLWEETLSLVYADCRRGALIKAEALGIKAQTKYTNDAGELITYTFEGVIDVREPLDSNLTTDADLYSRHFHDINAYKQINNDEL